MIKEINFKIDSLYDMHRYPNKLFYKGNLELLKKPKISIVGSRKPLQYSKNTTFELASKLAKIGYVIVSGGAIGIDTIAHNGAGENNTILVSPNGLNLKYPAINKQLIEKIDNKGLRISQFEPNFKATNWSFVVRNELVVALGEILIVSEANLNSGTLRSVEFALNMGKKIYTIPHRIQDSQGTNILLKENKATVIYDIDDFVNSFNQTQNNIIKKDNIKDPILAFCKSNPTFEKAINKFGSKIYEYELLGKITIQNNKIFLSCDIN